MASVLSSERVNPEGSHDDDTVKTSRRESSASERSQKGSSDRQSAKSKIEATIDCDISDKKYHTNEVNKEDSIDEVHFKVNKLWDGVETEYRYIDDNSFESDPGSEDLDDADKTITAAELNRLIGSNLLHNEMTTTSGCDFAGTLEKSEESKEVKEPKKPRLWKRIYGLGMMIMVFKVLINCISDVFIKKFDNIHPITLLFFRSSMSLSLVMPLSIGQNSPAFPNTMSPRDRFMLTLRCVLSGLGGMVTFYSLQHMPLGDQKMILTTKPFFTTIFARLFLKEPCGKIEAVTVILTLIGVVFVIRPPFLFGYMSETELAYEDEEYLIAALLLLLSTVLTSNIAVLLRYLRKENIVSMLVSREIIFLSMSFLVVMASGIPFEVPNWNDRLMILALSAISLFASGLNILAYKLEEAHTLALVDRSAGIVVAILAQYLVFGSTPGLLGWVGVGVVILAIVIMGLHKIRKRRKGQPRSLLHNLVRYAKGKDDISKAADPEHLESQEPTVVIAKS